jgi:putative transposase
LHLSGAGEWQRDFWDTRLRRGENYTQKWNYVRENPLRAGLVKRPEDWLFQGRMNILLW